MEDKENNNRAAKTIGPLQPSPVFDESAKTMYQYQRADLDNGEKAANEAGNHGETTTQRLNHGNHGEVDGTDIASTDGVNDPSLIKPSQENDVINVDNGIPREIPLAAKNNEHDNTQPHDDNNDNNDDNNNDNDNNEINNGNEGTNIVHDNNDTKAMDNIPAKSFINTLTDDGRFELDQIIHLLSLGYPNSIEQYSEHLFKLLSLLFEDQFLTTQQSNSLQTKLFELYNSLPYYIDFKDPINSKLYLIITKNFNTLIKMSTSDKNLILSTNSIRFLTNVMMSLNYWEIYNLLTWKPEIYHFLSIIQFNLNDCYLKFLSDYAKFNYRQSQILYNRDNIGNRSTKRLSELVDDQENERIRQLDLEDEAINQPPAKRPYNRRQSTQSGQSNGSNIDGMKDFLMESNDEGSDVEPNLVLTNATGGIEYKARAMANSANLHTVELLTPNGTSTGMTASLDPENPDSYLGPSGFIDEFKDANVPLPPKKRLMIESKLARKIIKRANSRLSTKSSNYDPDVIHECQLSSADEPNKLCLRRFSRKYELIRHQETVHSKKKKLFKCYVCVKQNPSIGPRIFTRHDTLAKHIRVNHKISGKEAKAEVSFSKKHAEIVEEGDITVHVGRRKTKVDFELRAHMERKRLAKEMGMTDEEFLERESEIQIDETKLLLDLEEEDLDGLDIDNLDDLDDDEMNNSMITHDTKSTKSETSSYVGKGNDEARNESMTTPSKSRDEEQFKLDKDKN